MNSPSTSRVWFVTGAGRGLGRAFAAEALDAGDRVIATIRRKGALDDLQAQHPQSLHCMHLDVRDREQVFRVVKEATQVFGRLDVVVNNAGYGLVGAVEEVAETEAREHLDTNVFGALWVTQAVLPHMRERGTGHIVQISSVGGVGSMPTFGMYNAGKWALEGFSEALAAEVAPFGIKVTIAELGGFATDWARSSMKFAHPLAAYDPLRERLFGTAKVPWPVSDTEADTSGEASPQEAARALVAHLDRENAPLRLLVGLDAPEHVRMALEARRDDYLRDPRFRWPEG